MEIGKLNKLDMAWRLPENKNKSSLVPSEEIISSLLSYLQYMNKSRDEEKKIVKPSKKTIN